MALLNMSVSSTRHVPGIGPSDAKIAIVGEAPGAHEDHQLKPFVGPAGGVLEHCLHAAGLIRSEVYLTNVVKMRPAKNDIAPFFNTMKGTFTEAGREWVADLHRELAELQPNVIVAMGATAMAALTGKHKIMKYRGYVMEGVCGKVIPTIHPAASLRGMYLYRHLIAADLKKAKEQSATRELVRPARQLIYNFSTPTEVLEWLEYYENQDIVCSDIEVLNYEVSCIGFASAPDVAISVPLDERWTLEDECSIWKGIQKVLKNPSSVKVFQNGIFDIHFLLTRCGIEVAGELHDTMIAHHIMYPELQKGLAFLVSIYGGAQAYYKDMVRFDNIKGDS